MPYIKQLTYQIEHLRNEMYKTYDTDPNHPQLLALSQSLDKLLNELDQML